MEKNQDNSRIRYKINDVLNHVFYILPKFLFTDNKYKDLSSTDKVIFSMLKDRHELSVQNNKIDIDGQAYIVFTREEIQKLTNICRKTVYNSIKKLESYSLIEDERTKNHFPNKILVKNLQADEFYCMPKFLFIDEFKNMSNNAKILYSILKDILPLSVSNKWINENGEVYINCERKKMQELLNVSKGTIVNSMKELVNYGLLDDVFMGLGNPNRIYLKAMNFESKKYQIGHFNVPLKYGETAENHRGSNFTHTSETQSESQESKFYPPEVQILPTRGSNFTHQKDCFLPTNDTNYNDTNYNESFSQSVMTDEVNIKDDKKTTDNDMSVSQFEIINLIKKQINFDEVKNLSESFANNIFVNILDVFTTDKNELEMNNKFQSIKLTQKIFKKLTFKHLKYIFDNDNKDIDYKSQLFNSVFILDFLNEPNYELKNKKEAKNDSNINFNDIFPNSETEKINNYIKDMISYDELIYTNLKDKEYIDEIVLIIFDIFTNKDKKSYIKIKGQEKSVESVKSILHKLTYFHTLHVIYKYKDIKYKITDKQAYLTSLLYNTVIEMNLDVGNQVMSDMYGYPEQ